MLTDLRPERAVSSELPRHGRLRVGSRWLTQGSSPGWRMGFRCDGAVDGVVVSTGHLGLGLRAGRAGGVGAHGGEGDAAQHGEVGGGVAVPRPRPREVLGPCRCRGPDGAGQGSAVLDAPVRASRGGGMGLGRRRAGPGRIAPRGSRPAARRARGSPRRGGSSRRGRGPGRAGPGRAVVSSLAPGRSCASATNTPRRDGPTATPIHAVRAGARPATDRKGARGRTKPLPRRAGRGWRP